MRKGRKKGVKGREDKEKGRKRQKKGKAYLKVVPKNSGDTLSPFPSPVAQALYHEVVSYTPGRISHSPFAYSSTS